jgi:hypothetical protein
MLSLSTIARLDLSYDFPKLASMYQNSDIAIFRVIASDKLSYELPSALADGYEYIQLCHGFSPTFG